MPPQAPPSELSPLVSAGDRIADRYIIQELLGSGGMGQVFCALEEEIERQVALKFIRIDPSLPPAERDASYEQFRHEAQALGSLPPHPNRVVLYQYGKQDGLHYMAMELVRGQGLDEAARAGLSTEQILSYTRQMARALVDVHASGLVHRDIKPENLIVTRSLLGDEQLKLIDFGIARAPVSVQREAQEEAEDRELLGTVLYMAPELLLDGVEDPRTDIYAIGVILYWLITGHSPFAHAMGPEEEQDIMALVGHHVETPPGPLTSREGLTPLPQGLERLVLGCLAKDPKQRFADASALLAALDAISKPPSARQSGMQRAMSLEEARARLAANQEEANAVQADVRLVPGEDSGVDVVSTAICASTGVVATADAAGDVRIWSYRDGREILFVDAPEGRDITSAVRTRLIFTPDGRLLALGDRVGRLWLVDVELRTREPVPLTQGAPLALAFDQAASLMVLATTAGTLELWDVPNRKQLATLTLELPVGDPTEQGTVRALSLSAQRHYLAAGTDQGILHVWNFKDRARSGPLQAPPPLPGRPEKVREVSHMCFSPQEDRLVVALRDGTLELWDPARRVLKQRITLPEKEPRRLRFSPDGSQLLVVYNSGEILMVDSARWAVLDTIKIPRGRAVNVDHTADGIPVASLGRGSTVQVWDLLRMGRITTLGAFPTRLLDVTIARHGETALTLAAGGYVDHWDLCTGRHLGRQRLVNRNAHEMHKAPEPGRVLACSQRDGLVAYEGFDINTSQPLQPASLHLPRPQRGERVVTYSISPDQRFIALGYTSGDVRIYGYQAPSEPQVLPGTGQPITTLTFSPDQRYLVTADTAGCLRLWDPVVGQVEWEDQSGRQPIHMVAFTPSARLLSVPRGDVIEIWNLEHRRRVARLYGHEAPIRTLVHGLDGRLLLSASDDGTARMWDMAQQRALRVLDDHPGPVSAATFDDNLRLLLTTSGPYLSIWRVSDAALLVRCSYCGERPTGQARWVAFTPQGHYTASDLDLSNLEFTRPGQRARLSSQERASLFDPRAVARALVLDH